MRRFLLVMVMMLPLTAQAARPAELQTEFRSEKPYGEADYSFLWMDVYHIALWTDAAEWKPNSPYAISITYRMNFTSDELLERTCDEMQRHVSNGKELCLGMSETLTRAMPDVQKGDRITAVHGAEGETRFYKNGSPTGVINDRAFSDTFFAIWLGENTSDTSLRAKLLRLK